MQTDEYKVDCARCKTKLTCTVRTVDAQKLCPFLQKPKKDDEGVLTDEAIKMAWKDCYGEWPEDFPLVFGRTVRSRQHQATFDQLAKAMDEEVLTHDDWDEGGGYTQESVDRLKAALSARCELEKKQAVEVNNASWEGRVQGKIDLAVEQERKAIGRKLHSWQELDWIPDSIKDFIKYLEAGEFPKGRESQ